MSSRPARAAEGRAIPAKGLTGTGYDGHSFWDTEMFVLPVLTYTAPAAAAAALRWRHSTLPAALQRARDLGLKGAAFPWRTIHGEECSGYWPAGTAAFHVNADIAYAMIRYVNATGDDAFERDVGLTVLVETARLWQSLGHHDHPGRFPYRRRHRTRRVQRARRQQRLHEPDGEAEFPRRRRRVRTASGQGARAGRHSRGDGRLARRCREHVLVPFDDRLGVHQQAEGFTRHEMWNFAATGADQYPLFLHFPYFDLYRKQVVKQPDLVLAMLTCADEFTAEQKARNFDYYERITVRDSSLSACIEAVLAAEAGHLGLAFDYAAEAALLDLHDFEHNTRDGLHVASLAGAWIALVCGFGGMRDSGEILQFSPRLPDRLTRLSFAIRHRDQCLHVEVTGREARYAISRGTGSLRILHHGEPMTVSSVEPIARPIPPLAQREPPRQPPGREPRRLSP